MKNGCCTENVQQPFLWIIQLSHPTRSGRVRVSSEQWGSAGPSVGEVAFSTARTISLMAALKQCVNFQMARYMDGKPNIF